MKQATKKKPKVFRTLVRLAHTGEKPVLAERQASDVKDGEDKRPR